MRWLFGLENRTPHEARVLEDETETLGVLPGSSSSPMGLGGPLEGLVGTVVERGMMRTEAEEGRRMSLASPEGPRHVWAVS